MLGINEPRGHDQADRGRDHRPRVGGRLGRAGRARDEDRQARRGRRLRSGRARGRATTDARRPRRRRLRTRRPHRRSAALRHPRVQDGEAPPRPPPRADGGRGHRVPRRTRTSATTCRSTSCVEYDAVVLAGGATAWRDLPVPGPRVRRHLPGDGVPAAGRTGCRKATSTDVADHRAGQARRDHRRRRHRRRLPRHRDPPGRGERAPVRDPAPAARRAARRDAVADVPDDLPGLVRARRGRRARLRGEHRVLPRRRRRQACGRCARTRSSRSSSTAA